MTQLRRSIFARGFRAVAAVGLALLMAGHLAAQETTGKIEGTVKDQAGAPIAGAQVLIVGSAFASTTNEQGYYFINNVPAGVMTVRAQFIGYAPSETRNVRVFAGQTMTVNLVLEQRAIEVGGITVTTEANPIVPRDNVATKDIVSGQLVQSLPVGAASEMLRLEPGVVESARGISIRGGRIGEAIIYLDGVPMRSVSGRTGTGQAAPGSFGVNVVGTNSLEEASVTTGAIGASQGDAQSGVISYVTRSGGESMQAYLRTETDEVGGQSHGQGLNRLEASLGGPLAGNLHFFASTTMEGRQSALLGKGQDAAPLWVLDGIDTTVTVAKTPGVANSDSIVMALPKFAQYSSGMRRPDNWSSDWNLDGKLTFTYGSGSRISAAFHRTRGQGLNFRGSGPGGTIYDPENQSGFLNTTNAAILNWTHQVSRSSEHALSLDASFSVQGDKSQQGLVDQSWFANNHTETGNFDVGSIPFVINFDNFTLDDRLIQNIRVNNCLNGRDAARPTMGGCVPFINRTTDFSTFASFRANPYGAPTSNYPTNGIGSPTTSLATENRVTGRVSLDWQADRYNRFNFGGDFVNADVFTFNSNLTNQIFMDASHYKPNRFGVYGTDRVDLGDVVLDLGLRYDRLNSGVLFPRVAGRIFSDPLRAGTAGLAKLVQNGITPTGEDSAVATACQSAITAADTAAWSTCNLFPASTHSVLLPSIRVSFPVTDRTGFRLSYAQQAQTPDFRFYASSVNTDLAITNTNSSWGQDITYGKTILFEFGVRHSFTNDLVLDVSAYNKDKVSDVTDRIIPYLDPFTGTTQNINLFTNQDFGNIRGIDFKLDRRIGSLFQGTVSYTFQQAKSTGSDPTEYINTYSRQINNVTGDREPPPQATLVTADNRTHTIAGSLVLNLPQGWQEGSTLGSLFQGFGAFATFRFASGLAYTRFPNLGGGGLGPNNGFGLVGSPAEPLNASTTPWIKNVDLRVSRGFQFQNGRNVTVFADFRNLFNWTNINNLFVETGDVTNLLYQCHQVGDGTGPCTIAGGQSAAYANWIQEAGNPSPRTINGVVHTGWDLSNCSAFAPTISAGIPDCIMMRRVEARYADGDDAGGANQFLTTSELGTAYNAWYQRYSGPQTLYGPGLTVRLGLELNF